MFHFGSSFFAANLTRFLISCLIRISLFSSFCNGQTSSFGRSCQIQSDTLIFGKPWLQKLTTKFDQKCFGVLRNLSDKSVAILPLKKNVRDCYSEFSPIICSFTFSKLEHVSDYSVNTIVPLVLDTVKKCHVSLDYDTICSLVQSRDDFLKIIDEKSFCNLLNIETSYLPECESLSRVISACGSLKNSLKLNSAQECLSLPILGHWDAKIISKAISDQCANVLLPAYVDALLSTSSTVDNLKEPVSGCAKFGNWTKAVLLNRISDAKKKWTAASLILKSSKKLQLLLNTSITYSYQSSKLEIENDVQNITENIEVLKTLSFDDGMAFITAIKREHFDFVRDGAKSVSNDLSSALTAGDLPIDEWGRKSLTSAQESCVIFKSIVEKTRPSRMNLRVTSFDEKPKVLKERKVLGDIMEPEDTAISLTEIQSVQNLIQNWNSILNSYLNKLLSAVDEWNKIFSTKDSEALEIGMQFGYLQNALVNQYNMFLS